MTEFVEEVLVPSGVCVALVLAAVVAPRAWDAIVDGIDRFVSWVWRGTP